MSSHPTAPSGREAVDSYSLSRKNIEFGAMNRHQAVPHERYAHASSSKRNEPLSPSFAGFIETTYDAMLLLESCLQARSFHVNRRPQDKERSKCITSGATFVYEESASGIKRWTDGFNWSPSRIMGNFLVYRELDNKVPANERKLTKRKRGCGARESSSSPVAKKESRMVAGKSVSIDDPSLRPFVGSLVDSYDFRGERLVQKDHKHHVQRRQPPRRQLLQPVGCSLWKAGDAYRHGEAEPPVVSRRQIRPLFRPKLPH